MSKSKRKKISFIAKLRNYFFTGIVVLVPIGITLYLTKFFISISSKLIPNEINPNNYHGYNNLAWLYATADDVNFRDAENR